jgi:putative ABC transport system substrate-binding protein
MKRRAFIALVGGAIASPLIAARAQQATRMRRVAWLGLGRADTASPYVDALRGGLRETGWIEGRNLTLDLYWATGRKDMEAAARELLASEPEVIVTQELMTLALSAVKTDKPVVFGFSGDPVEIKLVQSWARPGTNYTGMTHLALELVGKRIELLKEWLPETRRVAILARPQHPGDHLERQATETVVTKLGMELSYFPYTAASLPARDFGELETAFRAIIQARCDALVVFPDSAMYEISDRIANFAIESKLPSVSGWTPFAHKGLLIMVPELWLTTARSPFGRTTAWRGLSSFSANSEISKLSGTAGMRFSRSTVSGGLRTIGPSKGFGSESSLTSKRWPIA